jgi:hypothetical protein
MTLRIFLVTGDVRQGRYLGRDAEAVSIHDGRIRRIPFTAIRDLEEVRPPFEACLTAE